MVGEDMSNEARDNREKVACTTSRPALIGLTAGLGLGAAATILLAKYMVNRRVSSLPLPVRWAVKAIVKTLK